MAVGTVVSVGADATGTSATMPGTYAAGDLLLWFIETNATAGVTLTAGTISNGWAHITNSPRAQGSNVTSLSVVWKRAASGSETAPAISAGLDHQVHFMMAIRGTGDPSDFTPVGSGNASGANMSATGGTTTGVDRLVVIASANQTDTASDNYASVTNATLANLTVHNQAFTTTGNGGGVMVATGEKATAGATGTTTATITTAGGTANLVFALAPASGSTVNGTAAGTQAGTSSGAATVKHPGTATGAGAGVSAAAALVKHPGTSAAVQSGTASATGTVTTPSGSVTGTASGTQAGTSSAVATRRTAGTAAATGAGTSSATGLVKRSGTATAIGEGTGSAVAVLTTYGTASATQEGTASAIQSDYINPYGRARVPTPGLTATIDAPEARVLVDPAEERIPTP